MLVYEMVVAKRPKLIVLLCWTSAEGDCQTEKWILEGYILSFYGWLYHDKCCCRPFLLFWFTSPRCRYNLRIFETNAVLVKRTLAVSFIELPYKLLVINHPPPQVFVQNLHDFASSSTSLVTSRSNHDRRIILSYQEQISFSLGRIM